MSNTPATVTTCSCAMCSAMFHNWWIFIILSVLIGCTCITVMVSIIKDCRAREKRLQKLADRRLRRGPTNHA